MSGSGEEAPDDRWSAFQDPQRNLTRRVKKEVDPGPDLEEFFRKVLRHRSPRKRHEKIYKVAAQLVRLITGVAYSLTSEWKLFFTCTKSSGVKTAPLRALTHDSYECMVPLMRPLKPNAFKVVQRGFDEMPQHRCLVQLSPGLSREETMLVRSEWEPHVDKGGFLQPRGISAWFNTGVSKACSILESESNKVRRLRFSLAADGTALVHATLVNLQSGNTNVDGGIVQHQGEFVFTVNIFPVFILDELPSSVQLCAPVPSFGQYIPAQKRLRELIRSDLEAGNMLAVLQPKKEYHVGAIRNNASKETRSWQVDVSLTEHHLFTILNENNQGTNFRHMLIIFNIIREQFPAELGKLNNDILINVLFTVTHKNLGRLTSVQDWFLEMIAAIVHGFSIKFLPSYYHRRLNLVTLHGLEPATLETAAGKLREVAYAVKAYPKRIYDFTGYAEKKKGRGDSSGSNSSESESDGESDGDGANDATDDKDGENESKETNKSQDGDTSDAHGKETDA